MAEAFELADQLHIEQAHRELSDRYAEAMAALDTACSRIAELEALIEEHRQSYHAPEPEPEPAPAPEPEPEPPAPAPEPEPPRAPDEPPAPIHPLMRRVGSRE